MRSISERPRNQSRALKLEIHFGQGALVGVVRSLMAQVGLRGPVASAMFTVLRLTNDQILENATGWVRRHRRGPAKSSPSTCCTGRSTGSRWEPWPTRSPVGTDPVPVSGTRPCVPVGRPMSAPYPGVDRRSLNAQSSCTPPVSRAADVSARTRPRVAVRRVRCAACGPYGRGSILVHGFSSRRRPVAALQRRHTTVTRSASRPVAGCTSSQSMCEKRLSPALFTGRPHSVWLVPGSQA
jgi:hypothetical protein